MIHARPDYNRIQDPEGKIGIQEPVFLIRAKDKAAPAAVHAWAELTKIAGGDQKMVDIAHDHACAMETWQEKNGCKVADL